MLIKKVIEGIEYYVDEAGNRWGIWHGKEEAEELAASLENCHDCYECEDCKNCTSCYRCEKCDGCVDCEYCNGCYKCERCDWCEECKYSFDLYECRECQECTNLVDCTRCDGVFGRIGISDCRFSPAVLSFPAKNGWPVDLQFYVNRKKQLRASILERVLGRIVCSYDGPPDGLITGKEGYTNICLHKPKKEIVDAALDRALEFFKDELASTEIKF